MTQNGILLISYVLIYAYTFNWVKSNNLLSNKQEVKQLKEIINQKGIVVALLLKVLGEIIQIIIAFFFSLPLVAIPVLLIILLEKLGLF